VNILITGAAGFLGSRLTQALVGHGHDVTGIDNLSTGRRDNFPRSERLIEGDIRHRTDIPRDRWDVIYHLAASYKDRGDWERDASTNVLGTINVVREAERCGAKIVYAQTSLCYGPSPASPVTVDASLAPVGSYAVSKTAGESYIRDSGVPHVSLRLANIYGPRNLSGPVPTFYKRLSDGERCTVVGTRRDFVFVDDMVWVAVKAATQGSGVYHVSSGTDYPILDVYEAVRAAMGVEAPPPAQPARGVDDVATLLLDPSGTTKEFGWTAKTSLADGIAIAVEWYRQHGVTETYSHLARV
jgi:UDP-glucose 4-epimerase